MFLKTKLLLSLGSLAVAGGTGAGVYYGVNKSKDDATQNSTETQKGSGTQDPAPAAGTPQVVVQTSQNVGIQSGSAADLGS